MSVPRVTVLREAQGWASYQVFIVLPVQMQFTSWGSFLSQVKLPSNIVDILLFSRLSGEQS